MSRKSTLCVVALVAGTIAGVGIALRQEKPRKPVAIIDDPWQDVLERYRLTTDQALLDRLHQKQSFVHALKLYFPGSSDVMRGRGWTKVGPPRTMMVTKPSSPPRADHAIVPTHPRIVCLDLPARLRPGRPRPAPPAHPAYRRPLCLRPPHRHRLAPPRRRHRPVPPLLRLAVHPGSPRPLGRHPPAPGAARPAPLGRAAV